MIQFLIPAGLIALVVGMYYRRPRRRDLPTLESRCNTECVMLLLEIQTVNSYEEYEDMTLKIEAFSHYWGQSVSLNLFNQCMFRLEEKLMEKDFFKACR